MASGSDGLRRRHFTAAGAALPARVRRGENPPRPEVRAHARPGEQCVSYLDRPAIRRFWSVRSLDGFERPLLLIQESIIVRRSCWRWLGRRPNPVATRGTFRVGILIPN